MKILINVEWIGEILRMSHRALIGDRAVHRHMGSLLFPPSL
jgi:hypothetical protein